MLYFQPEAEDRMKRLIIILLLTLIGCSKPSEECVRYINYGDAACMDIYGRITVDCVMTNWKKMRAACGYKL